MYEIYYNDLNFMPAPSQRETVKCHANIALPVQTVKDKGKLLKWSWNAKFK